MAGKRPTRPQIRSRRRALNSYLLSTESSYGDLAKKLGVREDTLRKFLTSDTKKVRSNYTRSKGFQTVYNAAAKNHTSDLRKLAKEQGIRYSEIPTNRIRERPARIVKLRTIARTLPKGERVQQRELLRRVSRMVEYHRNIERDYGAAMNRRERRAIEFQAMQQEKGRPRSLYEFLDTEPDEYEIEEYADDICEIYNLDASHCEAVHERIAHYLGF